MPGCRPRCSPCVGECQTIERVSLAMGVVGQVQEVRGLLVSASTTRSARTTERSTKSRTELPPGRRGRHRPAPRPPLWAQGAPGRGATTVPISLRRTAGASTVPRAVSHSTWAQTRTLEHGFLDRADAPGSSGLPLSKRDHERPSSPGGHVRPDQGVVARLTHEGEPRVRLFPEQGIDLGLLLLPSEW